MAKQSREMTKETCINILKNRVLASKESVINHVAVTNVSFVDEEGQPFVWEEDGPSAGEQYAIANFNLINQYGKTKAMELFKAGEYQEACNTNLSLRVTPELGKELQNAMYANVDVKLRTVHDDDDNEVEALLVAKARPDGGIDASDSKAFSADVFSTVEEKQEEGMPK